MKNKLFTMAIFGIFAVFSAKSQTTDVDSIFVKIDSTIVNIIDDLGASAEQGKIEINHSKDIAKAMMIHSNENLKNQKITGYRICIFRDNQQNSRSVSLYVKGNFNASYPDIPSYRDYKNPYFYVNVGDFRTKDQAEKFKREIKSMYPKAWLVNDIKINLPAL
jgi:hypothetical protein